VITSVTFPVTVLGVVSHKSVTDGDHLTLDEIAPGGKALTR
jgi:hypothetical protein